MCVDFAIHDKGDGNPHAHIMLTMRAMDERGRWLPKTRKVYDLDENGQRYKCPNSRYWASHKEDTVDWNDRKYGEIWRHAWEVVQNRYLENSNRPERVDMRSYERQGVDKIPTVHMGPAVFQMERRGIETNIGNLNRDIKAANNLMASIRLHIRQLKAWLDKLMEALEKRKEPTVPALLSRYVQLRIDEREGWSSRWQVKGLAADLNKLSDAEAYLKKNRLLTLDQFENRLANIQGKANTIRGRMKDNEKRMRVITDTLKAYDTYVQLKPVFDTYSKKGFKKSKEKYAAEHAQELAAMKKTYGYLMKKHGSVEVSVDALQAEYAVLKKCNADNHARLEEVQDDLRVLKEIRYRISKVLPHRPVMDEPQPRDDKKPSVLAKLKDTPVSDRPPKQPQRPMNRKNVEL